MSVITSLAVATHQNATHGKINAEISSNVVQFWGGIDVDTVAPQNSTES